MHYLRLVYIIWIALWYRLDVLITQDDSFHPLQLWINICFFWRNKQQARAVRLRLALEKLGPIFVKFGQMLSTRRDLLPEDVATELTKLQDQVPPVAFAQIEQTITAAFNQPLNTIYTDFNPVCVASASVAQVHFATLLSGEEVAVKILRPNIAKIITQDLSILKSLAWLVQILSKEAKRLKPLEVVDEFARHTQHELDLTLEAANCSQLKRNFSEKNNRHQLLIPDIYWDYCRKSVMTMQRMYGTSVRDTGALIHQGINLSNLAHDGVEIFFTQVFRDGFFHADMHPGNIKVSDEGHYIALDFGIMGNLNDADKYYLARNFLAFFNRDYRDVAQAHIESGWVPKNTNREELEIAIRAICEPIFNKPLKEISFGRTLLSLFQMSRRFGVVIQPQLIMLQKTLLNIEGLGRDLDENIDLWQSARPFLKRWMSEQLGLRSVLKSFKTELPFMLKTAPEMPRLVHRFLTQETNTEQPSPMRKEVDELIKLQQQHVKWQKIYAFSLIGFLVVQTTIVLVFTLH
ncbi:MAG: ubiquinone biosynthesis regulatory protein kinase UbiB [Methylophilaceae bacterium]|nr:ubiquinone biosynthesis regulatory protein kinase UbiB [Methylophilaceae bacterium]